MMDLSCAQLHLQHCHIMLGDKQAKNDLGEGPSSLQSWAIYEVCLMNANVKHAMKIPA
jgi:hypothetical protein